MVSGKKFRFGGITINKLYFAPVNNKPKVIFDIS